MIHFFRSLQLLSDTELEKLNGITRKKILKKNEYFIREGSVCTEMVLIKKGILRSYYRNMEGKETTKCIVFENELTTAYSSFVTQEPTYENIHALCNTELVILDRDALYSFYENSYEWLNLGRLLTELHYIEQENRTVSFQKQTAKERYETLVAQQANYIKFIPLKHLSSFLGISPRHLSRLRNGT